MNVIFLLEALQMDEYYVKARLRRAQAYENEDKLEDALDGKCLICFNVLQLR